MTALVVTAKRQTERVSDFGVMTIFNVIAFTLSLGVAHLIAPVTSG